MQTHQIRTVFSFLIVLAVSAVICRAESPENESTSVQTFKSLLEEGLIRRAALNQVTQTVRNAQHSQPADPALDYALGLVLSARVQPAKAIECFEDALEHDPTYLPAWQALLRMRLIRNDIKTLNAESLRLAQLVRGEGSWQDESRRNEAAKWLGQVAAFLALSEVDLMTAEEQSRFEADLHRQLGDQFAIEFASGKKSLIGEYENLQQELEQELHQASEDQAEKVDEELAELADQDEELEQRAETLKLTAEKWKARLDAQVSKADGELKSLEREYKVLKQSAQAISRLIQRTQLDAARYQTELAAQGIRGRNADQQPAMIQLRQELSKYQVQYQGLEQRGGRILVQARQVLAGRALAVKKYEQATGEIVRETQTLSRWKKNVEKAAGKIEDRDPKALGHSLEKRLAMPASYFELDEKTELARLIELAGGTPDSP